VHPKNWSWHVDNLLLQAQLIRVRPIAISYQTFPVRITGLRTDFWTADRGPKFTDSNTHISSQAHSCDPTQVRTAATPTGHAYNLDPDHGWDWTARARNSANTGRCRQKCGRTPLIQIKVGPAENEIRRDTGRVQFINRISRRERASRYVCNSITRSGNRIDGPFLFEARSLNILEKIALKSGNKYHYILVTIRNGNEFIYPKRSALLCRYNKEWKSSTNWRSGHRQPSGTRTEMNKNIMPYERALCYFVANSLQRTIRLQSRNP